MTYTWTIGGNNYTTTTNSFTTTTLTASVAYAVNVRNTNDCPSNTATGSITVNYPGTHGQSSSPCGCANGTTGCADGLCKNNTTYSIDGNCTTPCHTRRVTLYNQCGVTGTTTRTDNDCTNGCAECYVPFSVTATSSQHCNQKCHKKCMDKGCVIHRSSWDGALSTCDCECKTQ
jgi:hypothetical protein